MTFYFQIGLQETGMPEFAQESKLLSLYKCDNNPGLCDDAFPESGGNAAHLFDLSTCQSTPSPSGTISFPEVMLDLVEYKEPKIFNHEAYWANAKKLGMRFFGTTGGAAVHKTLLETDPQCSCGVLMKFVAQIEERTIAGKKQPDMNFGGGGRALAYVCPSCYLPLWTWESS
jgi:hypothetical protein